MRILTVLNLKIFPKLDRNKISQLGVLNTEIFRSTGH